MNTSNVNAECMQLQVIDNAIETVSAERSKLGAYPKPFRSHNQQLKYIF